MPIKNRDDERGNAIKKIVTQRMAVLPEEEAPKPVVQRYIDPINSEAIISAANRTRLRPSTPPPTPIPSLVLDEGSADINLSNSFYASTEDRSSTSSPLFFTSSAAQAMPEVNLPHPVHPTQEIDPTRKKTLTSTRDTQQQPLAQGATTNTLKLLRMMRNSLASQEDAKAPRMGSSVFSPLQQRPLAQGSKANVLKPLRMMGNSLGSKENTKIAPFRNAPSPEAPHKGTSVFFPSQQQPLAQGSKANILKPVTMKHDSPFSKEDAEIAAITGHFSGPAISLRRRDRRPPALDLTSINTETTSFDDTFEPEDAGMTMTSGHFSGPAISLRQHNRRPPALSPASINTETTSFDDTFEPEDTGMATTSAYFAGPAISLRHRDRRPPALNLTSINTEAGFFRNASEPTAPRAPHKVTSVLFPSY